MSLDRYANLKQAIQNFSHRNDISDVIDDFIDLAENKIDNGLRLRSNELRAQATISSGRFLALPDRFLEMRRMSLNPRRRPSAWTTPARRTCRCGGR